MIDISKLLAEILALSMEERLALATEILASIEVPDQEWDAAWLAECRRRSAAARCSGQAPTREEARGRLLARLQGS